VLCTPSLLGLIGRLGRGLPISARMALRDTARNRSAAAPAISAVLAAVAGSVTIGVIFASEAARNTADYRPLLPAGTIAVPFGYPDAVPEELADRVADTARTTIGSGHAVVLRRAICGPERAPGVSCELTPTLPPERACPYRVSEGRLSAGEQRSALRDPRCASGADAQQPLFGATVGDVAVLADLTGLGGGVLDAAATTLAAGGVVTTEANQVVDGHITLEAVARRDDESAAVVSRKRVTVPAYVVASPIAAVVVSPAAATATGLDIGPAAVLLTDVGPLGPADEERLDAALRTHGPGLFSIVDRGAQESDNDPTLLILAIGAALVTLGAAGISTGLAAVDGRRDLAVLGAIGASPRLRRLLSLSQAGVIAGLGTLLGMAAGLAAAVTLLTAVNRGYATSEAWPASTPFPLAMPWPTLAGLLLVPVLAMLGAGLLTPSRLPIERRPR
jgi:putative ABC transport system permease protein